MVDSKYTIRDDGHIVAVRDFGTVKAGDVGGRLEPEAALSHMGLCWIEPDAALEDRAKLFGDAIISGEARVRGMARVQGNALVAGWATVEGSALIEGRAVISGRATVSGLACVSGYAKVAADACVRGNASIRGNVVVSGLSVVGGNVGLDGTLHLKDSALVSKDHHVQVLRTPTADCTIYRTATGYAARMGCKVITFEDRDVLVAMVKREGWPDDLVDRFLPAARALAKVVRRKKVKAPTDGN